MPVRKVFKKEKKMWKFPLKSPPALRENFVLVKNYVHAKKQILCDKGPRVVARWPFESFEAEKLSSGENENAF